MTAAARLAVCDHCGLPSAAGRFCCRGCEAAYRWITGAGLDRYYELRDRPAAPVLETGEASTAWIDPLAGSSRLRLSVAPITCAACVWLIEKSFARQDGGRGVLINPARGEIDARVEPGFDLETWTRELAALGYRLGPADELSERGDDRALVRTGIAAAIAVNAMVIAAAIYFGLDSGPLHALFVAVSAALGTAATWIGLRHFGARALAALRARAVSFDLPIAAAIALVFAASLWAALSGREAALYFDSLCVFVALVLGGRLLAERVLEANRRRIAGAGEPLGFQVRRVSGDRVETVAAGELVPGDVIAVSAGELVPVDCELLDDRAGVRLDWITGESDPRLLERGAAVEAGAINATRRSFRARVVRVDDRLAPLLSAPVEPTAHDTPGLRPWVAPVYLASVLVAALAGFALWAWWLDAGVGRGLEVAAAVLVVTCPCALGIGVPLAFELISGGLRRDGVFVRRSRSLDRLRDIRRVGFDKTGTLTEGRLAVADPAALAALAPDDRRALFNLAVRSAHPKSRAIADALDERFDPAIEAVEIPGVGVTATVGGARYQLGAELTRDGATLAAIDLAEVVRPGAAAEIAALEADGVEVHLVTGDAPERARRVAAEVGIDGDRVVAGARPEDKAAWVAARDRGDLLFVGDGLNDALALERATASATPASDRPLVANRADFFFTSAGLAPIRAALAAARRFARITRAQLGFALVYNAAAVSAALAGWMQPWLAAVLMPSSSIAVVIATSLAARRRA